MSLARRPDAYGETMFLRPRDPDDHRQFESLLPQCTPLFVYADKNGRDWVRWAIPTAIAESMGFTGGCDCCGADSLRHGEHTVEVDTAWDEVDWWFGARN